MEKKARIIFEISSWSSYEKVRKGSLNTIIRIKKVTINNSILSKKIKGKCYLSGSIHS